MRKKAISKLTAFISVVLCLSAVFNSNAFAVNSQPNSTVESISVYNQSGVIEGETIQLRASVESNGSVFNSVKWSSSNPQVISCTEDGKIKGLVAGESATITCKAKWGSANDSIKVYCVEKLPDEVNSGFKEILTFVNSEPGWGLKDICFDSKRFFGLFFDVFRIFASLQSNTSSDVYTGSKVLVCGRIKNYAYIRYGESNSQDGFVKYSSLEKTINGFLNLSTADMDVWANGIAYDNRKLTTAYDGDVEWIVGNKDYITYDETTGQIVGLAEGAGKITTITAKADGMTDTCTIHLLYKWPQSWTAKTNKDTYLYKAKGEEYKTSKVLLSGKEFVVQGDCGTNNGWAYGYYQVGETKHWGYIPIADVSTKGTISQYSNMTTTITVDGEEKEVPWFWPVRDIKNGVTQTTKARYITSPYGWRDTDPAQHKGIDITNGISSNVNLAKSIDEYEVVSAFAGKVIYVCEDKYKSCGYCVAIRATEKDPITGKYYVAIYMHLKYIPDVELNENVSANKKLGYVGNTGNSGGSHLHFEVNNQNLSYGQKIYYENDSNKEMVFGSVINPLFFYMNYYELPEDNPYKITINPTCDAMNYRKPLWYGDDIKESKEP